MPESFAICLIANLSRKYLCVVCPIPGILNVSRIIAAFSTSKSSKATTESILLFFIKY